MTGNLIVVIPGLTGNLTLVIPGLTGNLTLVIPGLTGNLKKYFANSEILRIFALPLRDMGY